MVRRQAFAVLATGLLTLAVAPAHAQEPDTLSAAQRAGAALARLGAGQRVRIVGSEVGFVDGSVVSSSMSLVTLRLDSSTVTVPTPRIDSLWVKHGTHAGTGALIGAIVGGVVVGAAFSNICERGEVCDNQTAATAFGALAGAVPGGCSAPSSAWRSPSGNLKYPDEPGLSPLTAHRSRLTAHRRSRQSLSRGALRPAGADQERHARGHREVQQPLQAAGVSWGRNIIRPAFKAQRRAVAHEEDPLAKPGVYCVQVGRILGIRSHVEARVAGQEVEPARADDEARGTERRCGPPHAAESRERLRNVAVGLDAEMLAEEDAEAAAGTELVVELEATVVPRVATVPADLNIAGMLCTEE